MRRRPETVRKALQKAKHRGRRPPLCHLGTICRIGALHLISNCSRGKSANSAATRPAATDSFVPPSPRCASASAYRSSAQQPYKFTVADGAEEKMGSCVHLWTLQIPPASAQSDFTQMELT